MADNIAITAGSGTTIATDDCTTAGHTQIIKLAISTDGSATLIPADATNGIDVDVTRVAAGTNLIGDVAIQPRTTGGWTPANMNSGDTFTALTSTAQAIKAGAGLLGGWYIYNPNTVASYVVFYNVAQASVTVGTTTARMILGIPPTSAANLEMVAGVAFDTAISVAAATTAAGNGAPTTALECVFLYK